MLLRHYKHHSNAIPDRGIHYTNETAAAYNLKDVWRKSQAVDKHVHMCKASYFQTGNNQLIVDSLSCIPAKQYSFVPDFLCVYKGCEVRFVKNLDVAAGLVNGAIGTVVKIIYNESDAKLLMDNEKPAPCYLIVDFPDFRGFQGNKDNVTFVYHSTWVTLVREKFTIMASNIPKHIRMK